MPQAYNVPYLLDSRESQKPEKYSTSTFWDDFPGARESTQKVLLGIVVDGIFRVSGKVKKYLKSIPKVLPEYPGSTFGVLFKYLLTFLETQKMSSKMMPGNTF